MSGYDDIRSRAVADRVRASGTDTAFAALSRVHAMTRDGGVRAHRFVGGAVVLVLFAVVAVVVLLALMMGANAYASLAGARTESAEMRAESSLLLNTVRGADRADAVYVGSGPEGASLVLVERLDSGEYETRIYAYEGAVLQEYAVAGAPYAPDSAMKIADSATFGFSYEGGLLTIVTDAGRTSVALRCEGGGAA